MHSSNGGYPRAIKRGNWISTIYMWFSYLNPYLWGFCHCHLQLITRCDTGFQTREFLGHFSYTRNLFPTGQLDPWPHVLSGNQHVPCLTGIFDAVWPCFRGLKVVDFTSFSGDWRWTTFLCPSFLGNHPPKGHPPLKVKPTYSLWTALWTDFFVRKGGLQVDPFDKKYRTCKIPNFKIMQWFYIYMYIEVSKKWYPQIIQIRPFQHWNPWCISGILPMSQAMFTQSFRADHKTFLASWRYGRGTNQWQ